MSFLAENVLSPFSTSNIDNIKMLFNISNDDARVDKMMRESVGECEMVNSPGEREKMCKVNE